MYQLSRNQEHFWVQHHCNPQNTALHIPLLYKFNAIKADALEFAISQLLKKYSLLHSKFTHIKGHPYQFPVINYRLDDFLQVENFDLEAPLDFESNEALSFVHRAFDFKTDFAWRVKLYNYKNVSYLSFVFHHIIIDLHSKRVFLSDFESFYNAFPAKQKNETDSVNSSEEYFNFCEWQRTWLSSEEAEKQRISWKKELNDNLKSLKLPADKFHSFPGVFIKGKRLFFSIDENISEKINSFAEENTIKPFVAFMAAYALTLSKFSSQQKINFGIPFINRRNQEYADTFGCFINILPVSVSMDKEITVSELIKQIRTSLLRIHRIQELPFLELHETRQDKANGNLFDVGFTFEDKIPLLLGNQRSDQIVSGRYGAQMELFVTMWHNEKSYGGFWEFNELNYAEETIKSLNDQFIKICQNLPQVQDKTISSVSLIPETCKNQIDEFNNTNTIIPSRFINDYISDHKKAIPNKTAIICAEKEVNYHDLDVKVNQLANYLIKTGIKKNDVVAICFDRSIDMVICMLASLKTGATYLPLDPDFPENRLNFMVNDSGAAIVLTQANHLDKFERSELVVVDYSPDKECFVNQNQMFECTNPGMQSNAYILYTSGSTGKPKGVKIHHEALMNFLWSMSKMPGFNANDVLLAVTTVSFDISVLELFLPLINGGTLIIAESKDVYNGKKLIELFEQHHVNYFQATPGRWNLVLQNGWTGNKKMKALVGGEALSAQLIDNLLPLVGELWNMYGPTETTVWSSCKKMESSELPVLAGKPIDNTYIKILSEDNNELPLACIGEVCIGGKGVANGYHNRDELTKEKFIEDVTGSLIYKTGDRGRIRYDLELELFGRIDSQLKFRGYRIEPNEIERSLNKIKGVKESVVKLHNYSNNGDRLIALLNTNSDFKETKTSIISILRKVFPEYMVPSSYYLLEEIPRMPNGKIDRMNLTIGKHELKPDDDIDTKLMEHTFSNTEKSIEAIWKKYLKIEKIGLNDNFFDIGGSSLTLLEVAGDINALFETNLEITDFFTCTSLKTLSALIQSKKKSIEIGK